MPNLKIQGGIRYTKSNRRAETCNTDEDPEQFLSATFGSADFVDLQGALGLDPAGHRVVLPGQCYVLNDVAAPGSADYLRPIITPREQSLSEDNISFRVGANYKFDGGTLLYATVSQGYNSGIISGISPSTSSQYRPAVQE